METALEYTQRLLKSGARARKGLGQNFLIDDGVVEKIVQISGLPSDTPVVEIGAGLGVLTRALAGQGTRLWAVELDAAKLAVLERELRGLPVEWIGGDALRLNVRDLWGEQKGIVIGNLPYYITSPLLEHFLAQEDYLLSMTVMVQKEVARRITAEPGGKEYGVLSVAVQLAAEATLRLEVPRTAFIPAPNVDSALLQLRLRPYPGVTADKKMFFRVVKAAFSQRRKTVLNSLTAGLGWAKSDTAALLAAAGIEEGRRAETISIPEYARLAEHYQTRQIEIGGGDSPVSF